MTNWIENVSEPNRLVLGWQAPEHIKARFRWAVGIVSRSESGTVLRYLRDGQEFRQMNEGKEYAELQSLGFEGYPAFDPKTEVHSIGVMQAFLRRTPPRSRSDFSDYLKKFRYLNKYSISDFALLGLTEAKLPNDGFSFVDELNKDAATCDLFMEIAGFRYYASKCDVSQAIGDKLNLSAEPENEHDGNAVVVKHDGITIGYVNRLQTRAFHVWLEDRSVTAVLENLNGSANKPKAYMFVRVRPRPL